MTEESTRSPSDEQASPSSRTGTVLWSKDNGIGALVFNNPSKRNAVSLDMWKETLRILEQFARDKDIRVVVLTGAGDKAFVSGADISKFETERASQEAVEAYTAVIEAVYETIYRFDKPVIAKIRGYCLGGGVGLAAACDVRICSQNARFGIPAARLGNGYAYKNIKRLVDLVGPAFAKEIFLTARQFGARESYEKGTSQSGRQRRRTRYLRSEIPRRYRKQRTTKHRGGAICDRPGNGGRSGPRLHGLQGPHRPMRGKPGLCRRKARVHGKTQAAFYRGVTQNANADPSLV